MADQKESIIQQFVGVTGIDHDRARFYLESASWNLEVTLTGSAFIFMTMKLK